MRDSWITRRVEYTALILIRNGNRQISYGSSRHTLCSSERCEICGMHVNDTHTDIQSMEPSMNPLGTAYSWVVIVYYRELAKEYADKEPLVVAVRSTWYTHMTWMHPTGWKKNTYLPCMYYFCWCVDAERIHNIHVWFSEVHATSSTQYAFGIHQSIQLWEWNDYIRTGVHHHVHAIWRRY